MKKEVPKKGVTVSIAAHILGVSPQTLRNWDKQKKLIPKRGRNGFRYYHIRDLEKFKRKQNNKTENP